jgi:threonine dehydratase
MSHTASKSVLQQAALSVAARKRIAGHIIQTPCMPSRMDQPAGTSLYYKAENFQHTGSFKLRGAVSKLTSLGTDAPLITASSGNHGIACSQAAQITGHKLTVVLPEAVAKEKLAKIKSFGTTVILRPGDAGLSEQHAQSLAATGDYAYVSPYNDETVIAGQGTIGLELLEQLPRIDNIFISMGGGGLISGIGSVIKAFSPATQIIGVSAIHSAALAASMAAGKVVETEHLDTLADGCAGGVDEGSITLGLATEVIDQVVHCSEDEIAVGLRDIAWNDKMLVEGSAAMALAAYTASADKFAGQVNVILLCGANFDRSRILPVIAGTS